MDLSSFFRDYNGDGQAIWKTFSFKPLLIFDDTRVEDQVQETQGSRHGALPIYVKLWSRGVDHGIFRPQHSKRLNTTPPIFLYVGRVAVEKNIEAFLALDLPGSKWVAGVGPSMDAIRARHPDVNYLGLLNQHELAEVYAAADVFVFPSKTDTFGLVLLEAMACGLPVAAYPVTGPLDVIGGSNAGALDEDLRAACLRALNLKRADVVAYAAKFSWRAATEQFVSHLHPRNEHEDASQMTRVVSAQAASGAVGD